MLHCALPECRGVKLAAVVHLLQKKGLFRPNGLFLAGKASNQAAAALLERAMLIFAA